MDLVGTVMGIVTIPMALLTLASGGAGLWLAATGDEHPFGWGLLAFGVGTALAFVVERLVVLLDAAALAVQTRVGADAGRCVGVLCGAAPMVAVLAWEYGCFSGLTRDPAGAPAALWLWSYGIATGPWTLIALLVGHDRRTLCGIRAYAGHLGYWLLCAMVLAGAPRHLAVTMMALPSILPLAVGTLLAVADREALRNVRI